MKPITATIVARIPDRPQPTQPAPVEKKRPRKSTDTAPAAFRDLDIIRQAGGLYPFGW